MKIIRNLFEEKKKRTARIICTSCQSVLEIRPDDIDDAHGSEVACPCCNGIIKNVDFESAYRRTQKEDADNRCGSYWDR